MIVFILHYLLEISELSGYIIGGVGLPVSLINDGLSVI